MSNSVAEAYLLILRSSMVPVVGEAVPIPFNEQIELDEWTWELKYEEKTADKNKKKEKEKPKKPDGPTARETAAAGEALIRAVSDLHKNGRMPLEEKNRLVLAKIKKANEERTKADKDAEDDAKDDDSSGDDNKLKFTFKKNVDLATTQLLNSMKAGEVMPRAIVSLYHRSSNAPVLLAIKFETVKLINYTLSVEVSETMSDMKEEWTATYEAVEYTYKNRPAASGSNMVTQGTVRVFKMTSGSLI